MGEFDSLSPRHWPASTLAANWAVQHEGPRPNPPEALGRRGCVSTAYNGFAAQAGIEALRLGGSSVDAALTTALTQITLDAGSAISFAGIMTMIHFDAATGQSHVMNACWNTVKGETDPATIPALGFTSLEAMFDGTPSGRTALVHGFMKGVEAAHARFGRLPFATLFEPSIALAEDGFPIDSDIEIDLARREVDLHRLPETRSVFFKPDGTRYRLGDHFRQPALARTLRAVAGQGADYMYRGPWAEKLVAAVQADGGFMTLEDLAAYDVIWSRPAAFEHAGATVLTLDGPGLGGVNLTEGLNLCDAAGLGGRPHWGVDGESLRRMALATSVAMPLSYAPKDALAALLPGMDVSPAARITVAHARELWSRLESGVVVAPFQPGSNHSDVIVTADAAGNMTAVCQSINCVMWGKTAINIDGVSIGDPAAHQQGVIAVTGPGRRLPDPTCIGMVMRGGKPFLAFSSMGSGLHHKTIQAMVNVLDFGMDPKAASDAPQLLFPRPTAEMTAQGPLSVLRAAKGEFPEAVRRASGFEVEEVEAENLRMAQGLWVGVMRGEDGVLRANSPKFTNGQALAL